MTTINNPAGETLSTKIDNIKKRIDSLNDALEGRYDWWTHGYNDDYEIVLTAVQNRWESLEYASDELQQNPQIRNEAFKKFLFSDDEFIHQLQSNKEFMAMLVKNNSNAFQFAALELRADPEFVKLALKSIKTISVRNVFRFISPDLLNNRDFILSLEPKYGYAIDLEYVSDQLRDDREIVLRAVTRSNSQLEFASEKLQNDKDVVFTALQHYGYYAFQYASAELRNDKEFVMRILSDPKIFSYSFDYVSDELKRDREVVYEAVKGFGEMYYNINDEFKNDREIALLSLVSTDDPFRWHYECFPDSFKNDRDFFISAFNITSDIAQFISPQLARDREVAQIVISQGGETLNYFADEIRDDYELVKLALTTYGSAYFAASSRLQNNPELKMLAVTNDCAVFKMLSEKDRDNPDIALAAISDRSDESRTFNNEAGIFCFVSERLKNDRDFVLRAIKLKPDILPFLSPQLQNDELVIAEAVKHDNSVLQFIADKYRQNPDFLRTMVTKSNWGLIYAPELRNDREYILNLAKDGVTVLEYLPNKFRSDRELVLAAVHASSYEFGYASQALQNDREIIVAALMRAKKDRQETYGSETILSFVNDKWRDDKELALIAVSCNYEEYFYLSERLRNDPEILALIPADEMEYITRSGSAFAQMSDAERADFNTLWRFINQDSGESYECGHDLIYASDELKNNPQLVFKAVETKSAIIPYIDYEWRNNKELILHVLKPNKSSYSWRQLSFKYFDETLRHDYDVIIAAIRRDGEIIKYLSDEYRHNLDLAWEALNNSRKALWYLPLALRNNREFMLESIIHHNHDEELLLYLGDELKHDHALLTLALQKQGVQILRYADKQILSNPDLMLIAILEDEAAKAYIDKELLNDPEFQAMVTHALLQQEELSEIY